MSRSSIPRKDARARTPQLAAQRLDRAFGIIESNVNEGRLPAAALAVAGPHGILQQGAFGVDDAGPVGIDHRFSIASVTKPIVATAVVQLVEEGRIGLSQPIHTLLPRFQGTEGEAYISAITPWHLLTHTSGIVDIEWDRTAGQPPTKDAVLSSALMGSLACAPGTEVQYSNDAFMCLGELVSAVDGRSFGSSLHARVLGPLEMTATSFAYEQRGFRSAVSQESGLSPAVASRIGKWRAEVEHPAGGLWSTAADLVAFGQAILLGGTVGGIRILSGPFVDMMTKDHTSDVIGRDMRLSQSAYGLGWRKPTVGGLMPGSLSTVDHPGTSGSHLWIDPGYGLVVAILANFWGTDESLSRAVISAVYGALEGSC